MCWIPSNSQCKVNKTSTELHYFRSYTNIEQVDVLLDLDKYQLRICVVGKTKHNNIVIFNNLDKYKEWSPFVALHGWKNKWIKAIAKVPPQWFGIPKLLLTTFK